MSSQILTTMSKDGDSTAPLDNLCQSLVTLIEKEENYTYTCIYTYIYKPCFCFEKETCFISNCFPSGKVKDWLPLERPQWQSLVTENDWTNNTSEQNFNNCFLNFFGIYFGGTIDLLGFNTQITNIGFPLWFSLNLMHHYFATTSDDIILNSIKILSISLILEHRGSPCKESIKKPKFFALIFLYSTLLTAIVSKLVLVTLYNNTLPNLKRMVTTKTPTLYGNVFIPHTSWQRSAKHTYTTGCFYYASNNDFFFHPLS